LVYHSLACATIAHTANEYNLDNFNIKGALLVAPCDVDRSDFPKEIQGFDPMPLEKMNFKTILVASENDPYVTIDRAKHFANCWNSEFINIGQHGHINTKSGFGDFPKGEELMRIITD